MLTEQKKIFADYYITCFDATKSYNYAGFESKNNLSVGILAQKMLNNKDVQKYIQSELSRIDSEKIASCSEILQFLTRCLRGQEYEKEYFVVKEGQDNKIIERDVSITIKDRLKATELLCKVNKMINGEHKHESNQVSIIYDIPTQNKYIDVEYTEG